MTPSPRAASLAQAARYTVVWGWSNRCHAHFTDFASALAFATDTLAAPRRPGFEAPTISNSLNEDYDSDGLTAEERAACESAGLEVRR